MKNKNKKIKTKKTPSKGAPKSPRRIARQQTREKPQEAPKEASTREGFKSCVQCAPFKHKIVVDGKLLGLCPKRNFEIDMTLAAEQAVCKEVP